MGEGGEGGDAGCRMQEETHASTNMPYVIKIHKNHHTFRNYTKLEISSPLDEVTCLRNIAIVRALKTKHYSK